MLRQLFINLFSPSIWTRNKVDLKLNRFRLPCYWVVVVFFFFLIFMWVCNFLTYKKIRAFYNNDHKEIIILIYPLKEIIILIWPTSQEKISTRLLLSFNWFETERKGEGASYYKTWPDTYSASSKFNAIIRSPRKDLFFSCFCHDYTLLIEMIKLLCKWNNIS